MIEIERIETALGEEFAAFSRIILGLLQTLDLEPDARVLDVGTGAGRVAISLALAGHEVITGEPGDDDSEYAKQAWREAAEKVGVTDRITYQPFDAARMPFEDGAFHVVWAMGALHHMDDPGAAVAECLRVLAPAGVLCIMEPNKKLLQLARTRHPTHPDPTDPRPFLEGLDLQVIREKLFDVYMVRKAH